MADNEQMVKKIAEGVYNVEMPQPDFDAHVTPGTYVVEAVEAEERTAKQSGNLMAVVRFKTVEGVEENEVGKKLRERFVLSTSGGLKRLRWFLESTGMNIPDEAVEIRLDALKGLQVGVQIDDDHFQGQTVSRVSKYLPVETAKSEIANQKAINDGEPAEVVSSEKSSDVEETTPEKVAEQVKSASDL